MIRFVWVSSERLLSALLVLVLVLAAVGCGGGTPTVPPENPSAWYVSPQGSDTQNTCHSNQSPCQTINGVLAQASNPVLIYIAAGTYYEYIHLYDLTVDLEGSGPDTIISGSNLSPVSGGVIDSVCTASNTSQCLDTLTIANLTIQNGFAEESGGGVYVWFTPLVMKNVIVSNNKAAAGGGIYIERATATLDHVIVNGNKAIPVNESWGGDGGGIYNRGMLTVSNSTIFGNTVNQASGYGGTGGGLYNSGWMNLTNVIIEGNSVLGGESTGGGIMNESINSPSAILTLTNSTLRDNHATYGGGLANKLSQVSITGTTINGNIAVTNAGGILNTNSGNISLINSTISTNNGGNEGGGIVSNQDSTLNMTNVTLANNQATHTGGLVYESGPIFLLNVILDGNSGGNCGSQTVGGSYNISSDASCSFMGEFFNNGLDPKLGPLQDNGGPTLTHALLMGSPAIDAGSASMAPNIDQRGVQRPRDGNLDGVADYDIGAFEYGLMPISGEQALVLVTSTPGLGHFTFQVAGPCFSGPGPQYSLLAQGAPGDIASVDGHTADGAWYHLFIKPGILCWASGDLGTFDGNPFGLPTLVAPPTPTLTPTPFATATRTRFPTWTWFPSPIKTRAPIVCSNYKNKTDCESHGCTWAFVIGPPICK